MVAAILVNSSCRKVDSLPVQQKESSEDEILFFSKYASDIPSIHAAIQFVKGQNRQYNFVGNLLNTLGVPQWNKAIVSTASSVGRNTEEDSSATVLYIPFVDSLYYVNAALIIKMAETDTTFKFLFPSDYSAYQDNPPIPEWTPRDVMNIFAKLDNNVSGATTRYEILDSLLLSQRELDSIHSRGYTFADMAVHYTFQESDNTGRSNLFTAQTVCHTISICIFFNLINRSNIAFVPFCPSGSIYAEIPQCTTTWSISIGGGSGGGSGGGGGWNPGPTGGNGGSPRGWQSFSSVPQTYPDNPCVVIDSLLRTAWFPQHLKKLRDSTVLHYETGISFTLPDLSSASHDYYTGQGTLAVNVSPPHPVDGILHNHYDTIGRHLIFSAEDLTSLAQIFVRNEIRDIRTFTFTLVTDSTAYILMIDDSTKFRSFINKWLDTDKHMRDFATHYYDEHNVAGEGLSIAQKEKNFLTALEKVMQFTGQNDIGLKLFRGNADMTVFTPLKLKGGGQVRASPCL